MMVARAGRLGIGAAVVALSACTGLSAASSQRAEASFDRTLTVSGRVDLDVQTGSGRIDVRAGQTDRVEIHARVTASDWNPMRSGPSAEERVRRVAANPPVEQTGNRIRIGRIEDPDLRSVSISYTLVVPARTALVAHTGSGALEIAGLGESMALETGSGAIRVHAAGGDLRASTGSGSIDADGVRGAVAASTGSGALRIQGEQIGEWRVSSGSGSIEIALAGKPAFNLDAQSSSGRIETGFPVTVSGTTGRRELRGAVNGGGPLLHLRTSSGRISIR